MSKSDKTVLANPNKQRTARHRAREFAVQGLYQWLLNKNPPSDVLEHIRNAHGFDKADHGHFEEITLGSIKNAESLHKELESVADRPIDDISPIEHAILLLGAYEFSRHPEIPYRVVINEAVELAKSFGGTDGHKYVNGVLDKLAEKLRSVEVQAERNS